MPQPTAIEREAVLRDGERLRVRQVTPDDREAYADAFARMSDESRRRRYLATKPRLSERELAYLTGVDHVTHEAVAALDGEGRICAVARYDVDPALPCTAEVAVEVVDEYQGRGIGSDLVERIVERARENGYARLRATMLWENAGARALFKKLGFRARGAGQGMLDLELELGPAGCSGIGAVVAGSAA
jgi:RimJ/RimL family protein N-acetyltransferase